MVLDTTHGTDALQAHLAQPNVKDGGSRFSILHGLEDDTDPDPSITILKDKIQAIPKPNSMRAVGSIHSHKKSEAHPSHSKASIERRAGKELATPQSHSLKVSELQTRSTTGETFREVLAHRNHHPGKSGPHLQDGKDAHEPSRNATQQSTLIVSVEKPKPNHHSARTSSTMEVEKFAPGGTS